MFRSARLKLTLWYFLTISFVLLLFSALIYQAGSMLLFENLSRLYLRLQALELNVSSPTRLPRNLRDPQVELADIDKTEFVEELNLAKQKLLFSLILIDFGILSISTFLAYILAGKTLSPIERALVAQKRFTTDAAHELRTPLTAIKTSLEVNLKDNNLSRVAAIKILKENLKDIECLRKLSNDLLLLSQVEKANQQVRQETIALDELLADLINKFQAISKNKNIKIVGQAEHELIKADYLKLNQLLSILIDNAIKYTPKSGKIDLNFFTEKNKTFFQVKDNGIGISKQNLPLIFDRFYQVEAARTKNSNPSFGLGLSIAKEIAKQLNANLKVESRLNKGSTFTLCLC